jgi:hypothetical protein
MKQLLNKTAYNFSVSLILIPFFIILNFYIKKKAKLFACENLKSFYYKLKLILRIISYLTYICWETDNFVIKSDILGDFSFVRIFLKIIVLP